MVMIIGGSGDVDLYVNYGLVLISLNYLCWFYKNGNEESC